MCVGVRVCVRRWVWVSVGAHGWVGLTVGCRVQILGYAEDKQAWKSAGDAYPLA